MNNFFTRLGTYLQFSAMKYKKKMKFNLDLKSISNIFFSLRNFNKKI